MRLAAFLNRRRVSIDNTNSQNYLYSDFSYVSSVVRGICHIHLCDDGEQLPVAFDYSDVSMEPEIVD